MTKSYFSICFRFKYSLEHRMNFEHPKYSIVQYSSRRENSLRKPLSISQEGVGFHRDKDMKLVQYSTVPYSTVCR